MLGQEVAITPIDPATAENGAQIIEEIFDGVLPASAAHHENPEPRVADALSHSRLFRFTVSTV
jgi:hypothetical protein